LKRLYIETNYLMSICTGRTAQAHDLLRSSASVEFAMPAVCVMEAYKAFSAMRSAKEEFMAPFTSQTSDIGRDLGPHAQHFRRNLDAAAAALIAYLTESEQRLIRAIDDVTSLGRLVQSSAAVLGRRRPRLSDPADDIIAASIIEDATVSPTEAMAFFSEDAGFTQPSLIDAMRAARVEVLETDIQAVRTWCS